MSPDQLKMQGRSILWLKKTRRPIVRTARAIFPQNDATGWKDCDIVLCCQTNVSLMLHTGQTLPLTDTAQPFQADAVRSFPLGWKSAHKGPLALGCVGKLAIWSSTDKRAIRAGRKRLPFQLSPGRRCKRTGIERHVGKLLVLNTCVSALLLFLLSASRKPSLTAARHIEIHEMLSPVPGLSQSLLSHLARVPYAYCSVR
ncbi:hypothetical protein BKA80DRAFT_42659 [Phyllosticta citrichinensis]